ncbi:MBL fold metallo-hydrolase [Rhizobium oryzicola]|uniref:MBL fold metallo-hydrolase n=1 Tax=Rhizobium oryzicola TaxID=1232668 RepID=A0ABT8SUF4_9HYPH|nr:MBL fold metallo-hydrolase [Rhizobium oryzicola]MDO1582042.1 MBL fold metallo-hydrolase [Rhizobium oryzicola]
MMLRTVVLAVISLMALVSVSEAQQEKIPPSQCQAIAGTLPGATFVRFQLPQFAQATNKDEVKITFVGHSTYQIESPGGVVIATDYNGVYTTPKLPTVVTMNKAHSTHYTLTPDPSIKYVLHGWSDTTGEKAENHVVVGDTYIRNVSTDIRGYGGYEKNGNSIFIFEMAGLCIGHLGHLHYELSDSHYAQIGRLDVVMVPVDGGLTMGADSMSRVVQRLRASLILPMHRFGPPLERFLGMFDGSKFSVSYAEQPVITVSLRSLPKKPLILIPQGL